MKMLKLCFLTYVKKGKSNEMLKYAKILLEGYKKRFKKAMVKYMLYPNIPDLINLNMS